MINTNPKRSEEPVWWGLFGAGGSWFAMITPVTIFVLGILVPTKKRAIHFILQALMAHFMKSPTFILLAISLLPC